MDSIDGRRALTDRLIEKLVESKHSSIITDEKYNRILFHLQNPDVKVDPHFKHWVKTRQFLVMDTALELSNALVVPVKKDKAGDKGDDEVMYLPVVPTGKMFDIVRTVHETELDHAGYKKCAKYISQHYFGISRSFIQEFCKHCPKCQSGQAQAKRPAFVPPVTSTSFLDRVQIDSIDMSHMPDGEYNFIGHFVDHFAKYHILFPLKTNTATEVAEMMEQRVLAYVGPPRIFHSNNGEDFVKEMLKALFDLWGGQVTFVKGLWQSNTHLQTCMEESNRSVERHVMSMKAKHSEGNDHCPWSSWLPRIMFNMNMQPSGITGITPFKLVLGTAPKAALFPGTDKHIIEEEGLHMTSYPEPQPRDPDASFFPEALSIKSEAVSQDGDGSIEGQDAMRKSNFTDENAPWNPWSPGFLPSKLNLGHVHQAAIFPGMEKDIDDKEDLNTTSSPEKSSQDPENSFIPEPLSVKSEPVSDDGDESTPDSSSDCPRLPPHEEAMFAAFPLFRFNSPAKKRPALSPPPYCPESMKSLKQEQS